MFFTRNILKKNKRKVENTGMKQLLWKRAWRFFKKLKKKLPYDPVVPFLDVLSEQNKKL